MAHHVYESCIAACDACAVACDHCSTACLSEANVAEMKDCIRLDIDCAAICRLASGAMARGSMQAPLICALCASICETCAAECSRHVHDHCKACAEACERCATACRAVA